MRIGGFQKTTLLDYPEHVAATVFLEGCNFRCPFCHNADLVLGAEQTRHDAFSESDILSFLEKRKGILQGVCVTGGEPTLTKELPSFLEKVKALGYLVKLDTNGSNPSVLRALCGERLIDYVAMDIKSGISHYLSVSGLSDGRASVLSDIKESIRFLIRETDADCFSYEFRTTCVAPLHTADDFLEIAELIDGATNYYLQSYVENDAILAYQQSSSFHAFSKETLLSFADIVRPHVKTVSLRGID